MENGKENFYFNTWLTPISNFAKWTLRSHSSDRAQCLINFNLQPKVEIEKGSRFKGNGKRFELSKLRVIEAKISKKIYFEFKGRFELSRVGVSRIESTARLCFGSAIANCLKDLLYFIIWWSQHQEMTHLREYVIGICSFVLAKLR